MYGVLAVFLAVLMLAVLGTVGTLVRELFRKLIKCEQEREERLFITPIIGISVLICLVQLLNLMMPVKWAALIIAVATAVGVWLLRREVASFFLNIGKRPVILSVTLIALVLTLLPCIRYNDLLCLHFANNDVAFYLSSMEWLTENSFFSHVEYTDTDPFNSLAYFMVKKTRIGTDLFGALTLSYLPLEAHQIYLILCAVFNALCVFAAVELAEDTLKVDRRLTCLLALFIGTGCSLTELVKQQYAPQILGISLFIFFLSSVFRFFGEERKPSDIFLLGLSAVATISVYSEYASYAVIVFIIAFAVSTAHSRSVKAFTTDIIDSLKMVGIAFFANVSGFLIALKFNLDVILSQLGSLENIDPYNGNITTLNTMLRYVFNVDFDWLRAYSGVSTAKKAMYTVFIICVALAVLSVAACVVRGAILSIKKKETHLSLGILAFFGAYLLFFRAKTYAYGEYKHIHLTLIPIAIIAVYLISVSFAAKPKKGGGISVLEKVYFGAGRTVAVIITVAMAGASVINAASFVANSKSTFRFDSSLSELCEAVENNVPAGETVGIMNGWYFEAHSMVYALRNSERDISILTPDSYYAQFVAVRPVCPTYIVTSLTDTGVYSDVISLEDYTVVWKNSRHCLLKNNTSVGAFTEYGFSGLNLTDPNAPYRYSGKDAGIVIWNNGDAEVLVNVEFDTRNAPDGVARDFNVYIGEAEVFSGSAGDTVTVSSVSIPAGGSVTLRIEVENVTSGLGIGVHTIDTDMIG